MIIDLSATDALHLFALSTAVVALGGVYWLVRDKTVGTARTESPIPQTNA
jgi:hypothetical protein